MTRKGQGWLVRIWQTAAATLHPLHRLSHRAVLGIGLIVALITIPFFMWARWGPTIVQSDKFKVTAETIEIPDQPDWIHGDVRREVIRDGSLGGLSVLDNDAAVRVAQAFELHTWVAEVKWATKSAGPKIQVMLRYRRPAIMVRATEGGFWPVDTEGVLLPPDDFSPSQTRDYLRLVANGAEPAGPVGTPFGDHRVTQATALAHLLRTHWKTLGIKHIVAIPNASANSQSSQSQAESQSQLEIPQFELESTDNVRIVWGSAPGHEGPHEARADVKLARLVDWVRRQGAGSNQNGPLDVDLRPFGGISRVNRRIDTNRR